MRPGAFPIPDLANLLEEEMRRTASTLKDAASETPSKRPSEASAKIADELSFGSGGSVSAVPPGLAFSLWPGYLREKGGNSEEARKGLARSLDRLLTSATISFILQTISIVPCQLRLRSRRASIAAHAIADISAQLAAMYCEDQEAQPSQVYVDQPIVAPSTLIDRLWFLSLTMTFIISLAALLLKRRSRSLSEDSRKVLQTNIRPELLGYKWALKWHLSETIHVMWMLFHLAAILFLLGVAVLLCDH